MELACIAMLCQAAPWVNIGVVAEVSRIMGLHLRLAIAQIVNPVGI